MSILFGLKKCADLKRNGFYIKGHKMRENMSLIKKRIIFIDDSQNILDGLKRSLRKMRDDWEIHFFSFALDALLFIEENDVDVVVSDMKMPQMNGAEFLEKVSEKYPHIVRVILSGQADEEDICRSIFHSHQYLSKPCDHEKLTSIVKKAFVLSNSFEEHYLKVILGINKFPSQPAVYFDLLEAVNKDKFSLNEIVNITQRDMALSVQILKLVNSSYFGFSKSISQIPAAIAYLGLDIIKSLVLETDMFEPVKNENLKAFELIWAKSKKKAELAKKIAICAELENDLIEECYTAGLIHVCGEIIVSINFSGKYEEDMQKRNSQNQQMEKLPEQRWNTSQEKVGASLLSIWGLPESTVDAIGFYKDPKNHCHKVFSALSVLHIADAIEENDDGKVTINESKINFEYLQQAQVPHGIEKLLSLITNELNKGGC